jgi:hypothetical protein
MQSLFKKIMDKYSLFTLMVIFLMMSLVSQGIAQKAYHPSYDLEIDNLREQKTISLFEPQQRLLPIVNKNLSRRTEITSSEQINSRAESYLIKNKNLLGFDNLNTNLRIEDISKSPAGTHLIYQAIVEGIPVYDARITVSVNRSGDVSFVSGNYRSNLSLRYRQAQIQLQQAMELAQNYLNSSGELRGDPKTELMVFDSKDKGSLLAYRVEIPCSSPFGDWEVFVDAVNGDIVHAKNLIIFKSGTDGTGTVWAPDPLTMAGVYYKSSEDGKYVDNNDSDHVSLNEQRISVTLNDLYTDDEGLYVLEGPYVKLTDRDSPYEDFPHLSDPDSFVFTRQEQEFEAVMVYYHIDESFRRLLELGFFENDTAEGLLEFEADPHGYNSLDNSYYSPFLNYCAFGEGGVDDAEDAAVILHEYAHALQYNISEVSKNANGETSSLLEGCSDYWAASYNRRMNNFAWNHVFLWDAGISSAQGDTTFWAGRRCDLDWRYSKEDSAQYAGTHAWGQIWSSALMRIWTDLGPDITDQLFIKSHYYWGTHPDFNTAAEAFIQADLDINGGVNLPVIIQWFEYHGLIDRQEYQPKISHDTINDVELIDDHYVISCKIIPSEVAPLDSTKLWLYWGLDSSFTDSSLLITGTGEHVFTTEIPGMEEPSSINYYFSAGDSLDLFSTEPLNAPEEYYAFYAGPDSLPPPPINLEITNSINVIELTWQQVIAGKFVSSKIYRSVNGVDFDSVETTSSGSLTDTTVVLGTRYYYYVTTVFNQWESNPSDTVEALVEAVTSLKDQTKFPNTYQLKQNYPNPFNPKTMINYQLPITNYVELSIYNLLGQKVATLVNERQQAGYHQIEWDAGRYSSGVYYYRMVAGDFHDVKKMILVR